MKRAVVTAAAIALVLTGGAGAYVATHKRGAVPPGGSVNFNIRGGVTWTCSNRGTAVSCVSGDASPSAELGAGSGGITVRVFTLRDPQSGTVTRKYQKGRPTWTFTAF